MALLLVGSYVIVVGLLIVGLLRLPKYAPLRDEECPPVTVLVTARNEERDLPRCLYSLAALDYPADRLQLVLVDDRSTDGTGEIIAAFAARHPHVVAISTGTLADNGLEAKARGVAYGMARATGDWVLITDADAAVHPRWIRHLLAGADEQTGLVGGAVAVVPTGILGVIERAAWGFAQLFGSGAAGLGFPFICVGPNMGIRRATYVAAGGLERASFQIAEDLALTQMVQRSRQRVHVVLDGPSTVTLTPVPSFGHLISQQRRWMRGGFEQGWGLRVALVFLFGWGVAQAAWFAAAWLWMPSNWAAAVLARAVVDAGALAAFARRAASGSLVAYLPVVEVYTIGAFLFLPLSLVLRPRTAWRGSGYNIRFRT